MIRSFDDFFNLALDLPGRRSPIPASQRVSASWGSGSSRIRTFWISSSCLHIAIASQGLDVMSVLGSDGHTRILDEVYYGDD